MSWELDEDNRFEARTNRAYQREIDADNDRLNLQRPDRIERAELAADIADEIGRRGL